MKKLIVLILCLALIAFPVYAAEEAAVAGDSGEAIAAAEGESGESAAEEAAPAEGESGESAADVTAEGEAGDSAVEETAEGESGDSEGESGDSEGESGDSEGESGESEGGNGALSTSPGDLVITADDGVISVNDESVVEFSDEAVVSAEGTPQISGVAISTIDSNAGGVGWNNEQLILGGEAEVFPVTTYFTGEEQSFNTTIVLDLPEDYAWGVDAASGFAIEAAGTGTMVIDNVYAKTTGPNRYSVHTSTGTTIIKDSYFESLGGVGEYCLMPWFTMQYGTSRNLVMTSTSSLYVYNSFCATDGFASWSTDMTNGSLYLYNADCINYNGGYGSFADGCTVNIYGSRFDSSEYGVFGCNGGTLIIGSAADAKNASDPLFLENLEGEEIEDTPNVIIGDRNAVIMHIVSSFSSGDPDHNGIVDTVTAQNYNTQNHLYATNSVFSTVDATGGSGQGKYPAPMAMYLEHMRGSVIEFRSSNADVRLENCDLESSTGILFQSIINMDSTAIQILDDIPTEDILGICIESVDNDWTGNISHEDYQRPMYLTFKGTTLTGAILAPGIDEWLALWTDYADVHYTQDPDTGLYVNDADPTDTNETYTAQDPNNVYLWATGVTEYNAIRGVSLTMDSTSVWNVTAESSLRSLTVEAGAQINGTVTVDGEAVDITAGGSWTGDIVVVPQA